MNMLAYFWKRTQETGDVMSCREVVSKQAGVWGVFSHMPLSVFSFALRN